MSEGDKKNYSFYMPCDFDEKIDYLRKNTNALKGLSKSQSVYFLISEFADKLSPDADGEEMTEDNSET